MVILASDYELIYKVPGAGAKFKLVCEIACPGNGAV